MIMIVNSNSMQVLIGFGMKKKLYIYGTAPLPPLNSYAMILITVTLPWKIQHAINTKITPKSCKTYDFSIILR